MTSKSQKRNRIRRSRREAMKKARRARQSQSGHLSTDSHATRASPRSMTGASSHEDESEGKARQADGQNGAKLPSNVPKNLRRSRSRRSRRKRRETRLEAEANSARETRSNRAILASLEPDDTDNLLGGQDHVLSPSTSPNPGSNTFLNMDSRRSLSSSLELTSVSNSANGSAGQSQQSEHTVDSPSGHTSSDIFNGIMTAPQLLVKAANTRHEEFVAITRRSSGGGSVGESTDGCFPAAQQGATRSLRDSVNTDATREGREDSLSASSQRSHPCVRSLEVTIERAPPEALSSFEKGRVYSANDSSSRHNDSKGSKGGKGGKGGEGRRESSSDAAAAQSSSLGELSKSPSPVTWHDEHMQEAPDQSSSEGDSKKRRKGKGSRRGPADSEATTPEKPKKRRVPAGTSSVTFPPISADRFGIVQETLWQDPYKLLIAVLFLNKTSGRFAMPVYRDLMERYPTPEALADAEFEEVKDIVHHLGLQNQRAKKLIKFAQTWINEPPECGTRYRTRNYPNPGDGYDLKPKDILPDDEDCAGALEVAHLPGTGSYAWDSWRIFCRDVLRGVASGYNGEGSKTKGLVPEWKRVVPFDKELRACLRWMWLREGWVWDPLTGEKKRADAETMEKARQVETEWQVPETKGQLDPEEEGVGEKETKGRKRETNDKDGGERSEAKKQSANRERSTRAKKKRTVDGGEVVTGEGKQRVRDDEDGGKKRMRTRSSTSKENA